MDKVFLDANVLFSAAYAHGSRLLDLWSLENTELVTSLYALEEARRNIATYNRQGIVILDELVSEMTTVAGTRTAPIPHGVNLPDKDVPIFLAAIDSGCTHLLTGDKRHFDALFGQTLAGVLVQTPGEYLRGRGIEAS